MKIKIEPVPTKQPPQEEGWSTWVEYGIWYKAEEVDYAKFGGHAYDNGGYENGVRNCSCGCSMGSYNSSGPVDPFGPCPKNPKEIHALKTLKKYMNIREEFEKRNLFSGRMISGGKHAKDGELCVWNANVVIKSTGKEWFGDLNITKDGKKLKEIATAIGEPIYVLRESDCRFGTENDPIDEIIKRAVWSTV